MKAMMFITVCLLGVTTSALAATVYKSVGPDGKFVYSDKPINHTAPSRAINIKSMPSSPLPPSLLRFREEAQQDIKQRATLANTPRPMIDTAP